MKRSSTRSDYEGRIRQVVQQLIANLDEPVDLATLAGWAAASPYHFSRIFHALLGESAVDMARRMRLERAAHRLRFTDQAIGEIAVESGYATHAAFIRSFREAFGCSPTVFRRAMTYEGLLPSPCGVHFNDPEATRLHFHQGVRTMDIERRQIEGIRMLALRHLGPYYMIGEVFGRLNQYPVPERQFAIAIYEDDPSVVPQEQLRSWAGFAVPKDLPSPHADLTAIDIPEGEYLIATHRGPYDRLPDTWQQLFQHLAELDGMECGDGAPFEVYIDDCDAVDPAELRTEIWVRLKRTA